MNHDLLENPADLLREVRENFIIKQDVNSITSIDRKTEELRNKSQQNTENKKTEVTMLNVQVTTKDSKINELQANLERVKQESQELAGQNDIVNYVDELDELEKNIVSLRSNLDERIVKFVEEDRGFIDEATADSLDGSISGLKNVAVQETADIMTDPVARTNILKIKLYRSMGLVIDEDNNQIIIETDDNKVEALPLDGDLSDFFKTKYIWEKIHLRQQR